MCLFSISEMNPKGSGHIAFIQSDQEICDVHYIERVYVKHSHFIQAFLLIGGFGSKYLDRHISVVLFCGLGHRKMSSY